MAYDYIGLAVGIPKIVCLSMHTQYIQAGMVRAMPRIVPIIYQIGVDSGVYLWFARRVSDICGVLCV